MRVVVLGAGVIGVTTAWALLKQGHDITVVERQEEPACETSFANGGQISVSHAEPWANPDAPLKILRWLGREDAPLLWRLRMDRAQWSWGIRFLAQCTPRRALQNIRSLVSLGLYSRDSLRNLRSELGLEYQQLANGILHFYSDQREFDRAQVRSELFRSLGCQRDVKSATECLAIEPALSGSAVPLVGGTFTADDESGDARIFTQALAEKCAERGARFCYRTAVKALERCGGSISAAILIGGERIEGDAFVVAMGSYSVNVLQPLGIHVPIYPVKGYSATIGLPPEAFAPVVSLTDDAHKLVFSRLGDTLRVAGTAEFNGYDLSLNSRRCEALARRVRQIFPDLISLSDAEYWTGLRPATPGNVPLIGTTKISNLWLNSGHGTLGWTMACGSAQILADIVGGRRPAIDPAPYSVNESRSWA